MRSHIEIRTPTKTAVTDGSPLGAGPAVLRCAVSLSERSQSTLELV